MNIKLDININFKDLELFLQNFDGAKNIIDEDKVILSTYENEQLETNSKKTTIEDIKNIMATATHKNKLEEVRNILKEYGVCRTNQIKEENIDEIYSKLDSLAKS